ncbi:MAG TPA: hypothetical protein VHE30_13585 [Polyangiaceae bacterium]|nr:hypothetical protein [Polyangiaceae bacterium]
MFGRSPSWKSPRSVLKLAFLAMVALATSLAPTGCGSDSSSKPPPSAKKCTLNSDCDSQLVCSFGLCHAQCQATKDCELGQKCVISEDSAKGGVCQLVQELGCSFDTDCKEPLVCGPDSNCRVPCKGDRDCLSTQTCAKGNVCADKTEVDPNTGVITGSNRDAGTHGGTGGGGNDGGGGDCTAGDSCEPAGDKCHSGTIDCTSGSPVCVAGAAVQDGLACDTGFCVGGVCTPCTSGGTCLPDPQDPCHVGTLDCSGAAPVCNAAGNANDGTACNTDGAHICVGGVCTACHSGDSCPITGGDGCQAGTLDCSTGVNCVQSGYQNDGTSCGTDMVCSGGACTACTAGDTCTPTNPCQMGTQSCTNGPVCAASGTLTDGTSCGTSQVCSGGNCVYCTDGATCTPTGTPAVCHKYGTDCSTGGQCKDLGSADDGTYCGGGNQYCIGGVCKTCNYGDRCVPVGDPCHTGYQTCSGGIPACDTSASNIQNAADGTACGGNGNVCFQGACVGPDWTLTVTSGDNQTTKRIDEALAPIVLTLVDNNGDPVVGAAMTITVPAGAYVPANITTNLQGKATVNARLGRATGAYQFSAKAIASNIVNFSATAVAPPAKNIFSLVNAITHTAGSVGTPGPGTAAQLYYPYSIAIGSDATIYIGDSYAVYALSPAGDLTVIGGKPGSSGSTGDNGTATSALFSSIHGLALDESVPTHKLLYVVDQGNQKLRVIDLKTGKVARVAGAPPSPPATGFGDGGPADSAVLSSPTGVFLDKNSDVYVVDSGHGEIRKIDVSGGSYTIIPWVVETSASSTLGLTAINDGTSIVWDAAGNAFISGQYYSSASYYTNGVGRFTPTGPNDALGSPTYVLQNLVVGKYSGDPAPADGLLGTDWSLSQTPYIAMDKAGNLYAMDRGKHWIYQVDTATDQITRVAGDGTGAFKGDYVDAATGSELYNPNQMVFDSSGNLFFVDTYNHTVRGIWGVGQTVAGTAKLVASGGTTQTVSVDAPFAALIAKLTDGGGTNPISGESLRWVRKDLGSYVSSATSQTGPTGTSSQTGRVGLSAGAYKFEVSYTDIHGVNVTGSPLSFSVTAAAPAAGTIFTIVNSAQHTSGSAGIPGPGTIAQITTPYDVKVASDGSIYLAEGCAVDKLSPQGELTTVAGDVGGSCGFQGDNGPGASALFSTIYGLALDESKSRLYIADGGNSRVRYLDLTTNKVYALAGGATGLASPGYGDGATGTGVQFSTPSSITVDPTSGLVYVVDSGHSRIRTIDPTTAQVNPMTVNGTSCSDPLYLNSVSTYSTILAQSNGDLLVYGQFCGTQTYYTYAVVKWAKADHSWTRIAGLYSGAATDGIDALTAGIPDVGGMAVDSSGNIYISPRNSHKIRKIATGAPRLISTVYGDGTAGYAGDYSAAGVTAATRFNYPTALAFTSGGHLIIVDQNNYVIREIW